MATTPSPPPFHFFFPLTSIFYLPILHFQVGKKTSKQSLARILLQTSRTWRKLARASRHQKYRLQE
jgi:hypothetical protein